MSEKVAVALRSALTTAVFVICIIATIIGHGIPGWTGLGVMMIGLAGILIILYLYNRRHR